MRIIFFIVTFSVLLFSNSETLKYPTTLEYPTINQQLPNKLFYLQIGAFRNKEYALVVKNKLEKSYYSTRIIKRKIGTTYYYKLLVGAYQNREEAELAKRMLPTEYKSAFILEEKI